MEVKVEIWCLAPIGEAERVEVRTLVAAHARGIDQLQHADLLALLFGGRRRRHGRGLLYNQDAAAAREATKRGAHGSMSRIRGVAIHARQRVEVRAPGGIDRSRVVQIRLVQRLQIRNICACERRGYGKRRRAPVFGNIGHGHNLCLRLGVTEKLQV